MGVSDKTPKAPIRKISAKVKETKVRIMVTTTKRVNMFEMGTTTAKSTLTIITIVPGMIRVVPIFPHKIGKFLLGTLEVIWRELRICYMRL